MAVAGTATRVLRLGIAGLGVAGHHILEACIENPHFTVTAAADLRHEALEKFQQEVEGETYESVADLCASPNVDAIYVCTPNQYHAEHVMAAASNGKHVIVEKPMALTIEECEAMNAAADLNGVKLLCGHTHSFDSPIRAMREIVTSGELGKLCMINTWHYQDWIYRSRMAEELDTSKGSNVVFRQGPHAIDIVRLLGGGLVRSVRAMTGIWDPARRVEGAWAAYLEFSDGTPATDVFSGYAHFDSAEFTSWQGEFPRSPEHNLRSRRTIAGLRTPEDEWSLKGAKRYGGGGEESRLRGPEAPHSIFGITIVSCEHGDIRQTLDGLHIYGDERKWEVPVKGGDRGRELELEELYNAVLEDRPVAHDGRWGEATLEVVLAIMQSARERKEIVLSHQVPAPGG